MATTDTGVLGAFRERPGEPLSTGEVADALGCDRATAIGRLEDLADDGRVDAKRIGDGERVWWVPRSRAVAPDDRTDANADAPGGDATFSTLVGHLPGMVYRCANEPAWPVSFVDGTCEELTGYPPEALEDGSVQWGEDVVHPEDRDRVWAAVQDALDANEPFTLSYRILRADGTERDVWEQGRGVYDGDELVALEGYVTDVTERKERERRLQRFRERAQELIRTPVDDVPAVATEIADDLFGLPLSGVYLVSEDGRRLEPAAVSDAARELYGTSRVYERDGGTLPGSGLNWEVFESGDPAYVDDTRSHEAFDGDESPARSGIVYPLGDHGVFLASSPEAGAADATDRALAELLATNLTAALDRGERERRLQRFQERVETLIRSPADEVATVATGIADELLDLPISGVNLLSDDGERLEPVAATDAVDEHFDDDRVYHRTGESVDGTEVVWEAFESGDPVFVDDTHDHEAFAGLETVARSGVVFPLGDHGVFVATSLEPDAVDATDRALAEILATNLTAALDRAERERRLRDSEQRYRRLLRTAPVPMGVFTLSDGFVYLNDAAAEFFGDGDREEVLGRSPSEFVVEGDQERSRERAETVAGDREMTDPTEFEFRSLDGDERIAKVTSAPVTYEGADAGQFVLRDVTEYRRAQETIEEQRRFFERAIDVLDDIFYVVDEDNHPVIWNETLNERTGYTDDEIAAMTPWDLLPDDQAEAAIGAFESVTDLDDRAIEMDLVTRDGERIPHEFRAVTLDDDSGDTYRVGIARDVTEQLEREARLRRSEQRYRRLLETSPAPVLIYDVDGTLVYGNDAAVEFVGADDREALLGTSIGELAADDSQRMVAERHRRLVEADEPVPPVEEKLPALDGETKHAMVSSAPVTYEGEDAIQTVAIDVTDRVEQRRELRRQRDRVEALNWLNEVVQETAHVVAESSTREEIERLVTERLAASGSFEGAWIGGPGDAGGGVESRVDAGDADHGDRTPGRTAAAEAVETGQCRAFTHSPTGGDGDGTARAGVATPIAHEGVTYGVLVVYDAREEAFDRHERTVVTRLGDILGHAVAAAQRKAALMGGTATELEFRSVDLVEPLLEATRETDATLTLDRAVPLDDATVFYCTLSGMAPERLAEIGHDVDRIRSIRRLDEAESTTRFEVVVGGETAVSTVAAVGGRVQSLRVADGEVRLTVQVPAGSDVRGLVEAIQSAHGVFELVSRERVDRSNATRPVPGSLDELLTDRQQSAVEAAYFAGYFEHPRRSTGTDVADVLGVSAATFHEHLRIAERKLLETLLQGDQ